MSNGDSARRTNKQVVRERATRRQHAREANVAAARWSGIQAEAARLGLLGPIPANRAESRHRAPLALRRRVDALFRQVAGLAVGPAEELEKRCSVLLQVIDAHLDPSIVTRASHPGPVPSDASAERGWTDLVGDLVLRLSDLWSTDVRMVINGLWTARIDRVLDSASFCVAWRIVTTIDEAESARRAGWGLWRPDRELEINRWRGRTEPCHVDETGYLVVTLRHTDIRQFADRLVEGARAASVQVDAVRVRSDECSGDEHLRRMRLVGLLERRTHRQSNVDRRPVLGYCRNCGQP